MENINWMEGVCKLGWYRSIVETEAPIGQPEGGQGRKGDGNGQREGFTFSVCDRAGGRRGAG